MTDKNEKLVCEGCGNEGAHRYQLFSIDRTANANDDYHS
jgi:hypothetical protein